MTRTPYRRVVGLLVLAVGATAGLAACGGNEDPELPAGTVATVDGTAIEQARFDHWLAITRREAEQNDSPLSDEQVRSRVLSNLVRARWTAGEAAARGVTVSDAEVDAEFAKTEKLTFAGDKTFAEYLKSSGLSEADLRERIRNGALLLALNRRLKQDAGGPDAPDVDARLLAETREYQARWKAKTLCRQELANKDCANYRTAG